MKSSFLLIILMLFSACKSQEQNKNMNVIASEIEFEDRFHYRMSLISGSFLVLDNQSMMDEVFEKINSDNVRGAPIPMVNEAETYLIFRPVLKTSNDIEIKKITFQDGTLTIDVVPFNDPQMDENNKVEPNVLVCVKRKLAISNVVIIQN